MQARDVDHMFGFQFEKSSAEIKQRASGKIKNLTAKVKEREKRVAALREAHDIDDGALVQLLTAARRQSQAAQYTYTSSVSNALVHHGKRMEEKTIGAGVVQNLLTESDFIEAEKASIKRLGFLVRNLRAVEAVAKDGAKYLKDRFTLSYEELEYLGF